MSVPATSITYTDELLDKITNTMAHMKNPVAAKIIVDQLMLVKSRPDMAELR